MAEKYCYYKIEVGLFTNEEGETGQWTSHDGVNWCNEDMLINLGATKLLAYKLKVASAQYPINSIFAQQPGDTSVYRYVHETEVSYISADLVTNATYYDEVQYLISYML